MADFATAYAPLKEFEGGYANVKADSGGETYGGIARNFWPGWAGWKLVDAAKVHSSYAQGSRAFSKHLAAVPGLADMVADWYRAEWWDRMGLSQLPQALADEIFEQAVNMGRGGAGRYVQRLCNAFNYDNASHGPLFDDLVEDGAIGPKTLAAMTTLVSRRADEGALVHALNCLQGAHYLGIAANRPSQRLFVNGWMSRTHDPA
jgi:lysozyme family protein